MNAMLDVQRYEDRKLKNKGYNESGGKEVEEHEMRGTQ